MTIKFKLTALITFIIISIASMYGMLHFAINNVSSLKDAETEVSNLESSMLTLRRHEKDFLARDDIKYLKRFDDTVAAFQAEITTLEEHLDHAGIPHEKTKDLHIIIDTYADNFHQLVKLKQEIGLSHNEGLRGELRKAVHGAESKVKELDNYHLLADILQLRRNEKDFLIRKDLKYRKKFEANFEKLNNDLETELFNESDITETKQLLSVYRSKFLTLIDNYEQLGLSSKQGLLGEMRKSIHKSETLLDEQVIEITERLENEIASIQLFSSIKAIIIAGIVSAIALWIAHNIISRLRNLQKVMGNAKENKDLTVRYNVVSKDELSDMGHSFNSMMSEFQSLLDRVNNSSMQLSAAAEEVSAIAVETSQGLETQKAQVIQVSAAVQEMESAMREIAHNTELTAQTASHSQQSAAEGQRIISHAIENINNLAEGASQSTEAVTLLEENGTKIGTVLDVIKGIAEQTNLLALNASIEAARAGDHGRGFSVVADEVRGLAGRSQESATEIDVMINDLQQQTGQVSNLMMRSVEVSAQSAEEAGTSISALDKIMNDATNIVDMTSQVAAAVEQQTAMAGDINNNAEQIQTIVEVASEQVGQNAEASEEVAKQAAYLQQIVGQFKVK
ncbi:methyl-accepting chemotaxis protein [Neptuniibacter sp. QD72_48]|uniref:methyl-accepting chemotaxis protein n=1 Tax=unclassified Neptuniibacter TaxID=2630693 RepID=UPI0039F52A76